MSIISTMLNLILSCIRYMSKAFTNPLWKRTRRFMAVIGTILIVFQGIDTYMQGRLQEAFLVGVQKHILLLIPMIIIAALLPPTTAFIERSLRKDMTIATNIYIRGNAIFNVAGAFAVIVLTVLFKWQIKDTLRFGALPIWILVAVVLELSILAVIMYQEKEMNTKSIEDHSTDV